MKNRIAIERIYALGNYQNIKYISEITEIPEEVMLNGELLDTLRMLQLLEIEGNFSDYMRMQKDVFPDNFEERVQVINDMKSQTLEFIVENYIKNGKTEN